MPVHIPVFDHSAEANVSRMPPWVRQSLANGDYGDTARLVQRQRLNTVCEEARCPNRGECWGRGTATFMLLGDTCTRACGFCAVATGRPEAADPDEPRRLAEAVAEMGLDYVVLTSVNRDDLPDGGAAQFAASVRELQARRADLGIELLTPDFRQDQPAAVAAILDALLPGTTLVFGHNVETVPDLYQRVRKGAKYPRSLELLRLAAADPRCEAKSSLMLGLGESREQVLGVLGDLRAVGVTRLALGQYLRPTRHHLPVREYLTPEQFADYADEAKALGFTWVKSGAMVRSSYHAES